MTARYGFGGLVVAVLVMSACGGSSDKSGGTPGTQASSATQVAGAATGSGTDAACKLIGQDDASKLFGHPAAPKVDPSPVKPAESACLWEYKSDPGQPDDVIYLLQIRVYPKAHFYEDKRYPDGKPVSGLGDRAFITESTGLTGVKLQYVKDGKTYSLSYAINALEGEKPDPAQMPAQLEALVRQADARAS